MEERKKRQLEELLRGLQASSPTKDFTTNVMNDLDNLLEDDYAIDENLATLLKKRGFDMPSKEFVDKVMLKIETNSSFVYRPIISRTKWLLIISVFLLVASFVSFGKIPTEPTAMSEMLTPTLIKTYSVFESIQVALQKSITNFEISSLLAMSLTTLSVLVFVDFIAAKRNLI